MKYDDIDIAVIGGSGIYKLDGVSNVEDLGYQHTPFGKTSSPLFVGEINNEKIVFLARHDTTHRLTPSEIPFRANIYALKQLGVKYLLSFAACGSLIEENAPSHFVVVDQFIDRTKAFRVSTFFGNGVVGHVPFADPTCKTFSKLIYDSIKELETIEVHPTGTYVTMEGPQFSTRAESHMYRKLGGTVIGMTALQEAKLAREAEISFGVIAMVTDYDCWYENHDDVTVQMVMETMKKNVTNANLVVKKVIENLQKNKFESFAHKALLGCIMTKSENIPEETKNNLKPIMGKYIE